MKKLSECNLQELTAIFENNSDLRALVLDDALDNAYFWVNEKLQCFRNVRGKYPIDFDDRYGMTYQIEWEAAEELIDGFKNVNHTFCVFSEEAQALLDRLAEKTDLYYKCFRLYDDMTDKARDSFMEWFEAGAEKIADELRNDLQAEIDSAYDDEYLCDYFVDFWADERGADLETDGRTVFETIVKKYA